MIVSVPWDTAPERVEEISAALDLSGEVETAAVEIATQGERQTGCAPSTLAGAAIYRAAIRNSEHVTQHITQKRIADAADVTVVGLRNALYTVRDLLDESEEVAHVE